MHKKPEKFKSKSEQFKSIHGKCHNSKNCQYSRHYPISQNRPNIIKIMKFEI